MRVEVALMAIEFDCSGCGRTYRVDDALVGKRTKCKICDAILTVPQPRGPKPASRPPLQTFGGPAAPSARPAPAPTPGPRPKLQPEPEPSSAHLYGIDDDDDGPSLAKPLYDDDPEEEIQGPRRPARPGKGTAKGKSSRIEFAGIGRRFAAVFIDLVFLVLAQLTLAFAYGFAIGLYYGIAEKRPATQEELASAIRIFYVLWLVVVLIYYGGMTSSSYQGTLGKVAMGIKICDLDGRPIGFGRGILRELAKIPSSIFLIGFIMAFFTEKKQALHDILVKTLVVRS